MADSHAQTLVSHETLEMLQSIDWLGSMMATAPELMLGLTAIAVVCVDLFLQKRNSYYNGLVALAGTGIALLLALSQGLTGQEGVFLGSYVSDGITNYFRGFFILAGATTILISSLNKEIDQYRQGEYYACLIIATLAMCVVAAAGNLILLIVAFETMSLMSYVLVAYAKGTRRATEASLKYLLFGGVSSGVMIFGLSYLYGLSGTTDLTAMAVGAFSSEYTVVAFTGLILAMVGIGFKISMVPFHSWTPDVYQGAPLPVAAFFSVASKGAGFAVLIRLVWPLHELIAISEFARPSDTQLHLSFAWLFGIMALITMTYGNLVALRQKDFKRLLAYSSIAQAGYMLLAFTNMNDATLQGLLAFLLVYLFMNMGFFFIVQMLENERGTTEIAAYKGYWQYNKLYVGALVMIAFSLIGLPPMAGLMAKIQLFYGVITTPGNSIDPWLFILVLAALLNSVISLYYYIYPAKVMILEAEEEGTDWAFPSLGLSQWTYAFLLLFITVAPLLYLFFYWGIVSDLVGQAVAASPGYFSGGTS